MAVPAAQVVPVGQGQSAVQVGLGAPEVPEEVLGQLVGTQEGSPGSSGTAVAREDIPVSAPHHLHHHNPLNIQWLQ